MRCIITILLSVFYLLPGSRQVTADRVSHIYDYLPFESDGTNRNTDISPERGAGGWFAWYNGISQTDMTRFITEGDILAGGLRGGDVTVLWINIDRVGYSLEMLDAEFDEALCSELRSFVQRGGCLLLTKQAARLVTKIGRALYWPSTYGWGGYMDAGDTWYMTYDFCTGDNRDDHPVYRYTTNHEERDGVGHPTCFPLCGGNGIYRRTDNNHVWGDWGAYAINAGGCDPARRRSLEMAMHCHVLGGWGHTRGLDCAGMIEFEPVGDYVGTIITIGLAAYQWGPQNTCEYNVKGLTQGCLEYLNERGVNPYTPPVTSSSTTPHSAQLILENGQLKIVSEHGIYSVMGQMCQ